MHFTALFVCIQHLTVETAAQALTAKNDKLESLCRALQQERNQLNEQLKEYRPQKVITFVFFFFLGVNSLLTLCTMSYIHVSTVCIGANV